MFKHAPRRRTAYYQYHFLSAEMISIELYEEIIEWCSERYGNPGYDPEDHNRWGATSVIIGAQKLGTIWFQREDDAIEFKLRWV